MVLSKLTDGCPGCGRSDQQETDYRVYESSMLVRCGGCDLVYVAAALDEQWRDEGQNDNRFYQDAKRWRHRVQKSRRQIQYLIGNTPVRDRGVVRLLDIGCAGGYVLEAARRLGVEARGTDISKTAVDWCRKRGYQVEVGRMDGLPYEDGAFSHIIMKHVLEHDAGLAENLREVARVSRRGTRLYVAVPERAYWKNSRRADRLNQLRSGHYLHFSAASLQCALRRHGWQPALLGKYAWNPGFHQSRGVCWMLEALRQIGPGAIYRLGGLCHLRRELVLVAELST